MYNDCKNKYVLGIKKKYGNRHWVLGFPLKKSIKNTKARKLYDE